MNELVKQLTDQAGKLPEAERKPTSRWLLVFKYVAPLIFLAILIIPGYTYFAVDRAGGLLFGPGVDPSIRFYTLFRLFGLYAFTFLWGQLMFGPFMKPLGELYGRNWFYFHRAQGLFALLLAIMHPLILYAAYYLQSGMFNPVAAMDNYVGPELIIFPYLELTALVLMIVTVSTALLMNRPWLQKRWHTIHILNYVVFILAFVHSAVLGTEVHQQPLMMLYWFFGITFVLAFVYRRGWRVRQELGLRTP